MKPIDIEHSKNKETRFVQLILKWGEKNKRSFPWRKNRTPYKVLLAEILLQRTPANRVSAFFPGFVKRFPKPQSIVSTSIDDMEKFLQPMGLKKRAEWLVRLMKEICKKYNYKIPHQESELTQLPGVGRYTARAVLSFGFGKDMAIVDVNVARVLSRVFGLSKRKKRPNADGELWAFASKFIPEGSGPKYNETLLDFAALVCRKNPLCNNCPINEVCEYHTLLLARRS